MIWQGVELLRAPQFTRWFWGYLPILLLELPEELFLPILIHDLDLEGIHVAFHTSQAVGIIRTGELPLCEHLDVLHPRVMEVEGRHDRDDAGILTEDGTQVISLQLLRILVVDEVDLGHRRPDGDVFELEGFVTGVDDVGPDGLDGYHVVLVTVHEEPLQPPGIA
jgi:hypothetical protein